MIKELIIDDLYYNDQDCILHIDLEPQFENTSFDAHNISGSPSTYVRSDLTDFKYHGATIFLIDKDGGDAGEINIDSDLDEALSLVDRETLIQALRDELQL